MATALPARLQIDAWRGATADGGVVPQAVPWVAKDRLLKPPSHLFPSHIDANDWRDPRVGWGLILPEPKGDHGIPTADLATAGDQPAAVRRLVAHRSANGTPPPIFRFKPDAPAPLTQLRNYATGAHPAIGGAPQGTAKGAIPLYLLVYGTPAQIPWELQSILSTARYVGRLDLREDEGLDNYVDALISADWRQSDMDVRRTIVWATHHNDDDITALMRASIAAKIAKAYADDGDLAAGRSYIDGKVAPATFGQLFEQLQPIAGTRKRPAVVVTTSHGLTDATLTPAQQKLAIGLPVDHHGQRLDVDQLLANAWQPDGAIWYAHACCSAGSTDLSVFEGLTAPTSAIAEVLKTVTDFTSAAGACVAPLPRRLLGAERPLRAFVGHVEPTFDWTLRNQLSGQFLTDDLRHAFYQELYTGATIGRALQRWFLRIGTLGTQYEAYRKKLAAGDKVEGDLLFYQLAQRDVCGMVILGDPTVRLPIPQAT